MFYQVFFFDDLVNRPDWLRQRLVEFITGSSAGKFTERADFNKKKDHLKIEFSEAARAHIRTRLEPELEKCRDLFGDVARHW